MKYRQWPWGVAESEGWVEPDGLRNLGEEGETAYKLGFQAGQEGSKQYFTQLHDFILSLPSPLHSPLLSSLSAHIPSSLSHHLPFSTSFTEKYYNQALIDHKTIFQTDKSESTETGESAQEWLKFNQQDGWKVDFFSDEKSQSWVDEIFTNSDVQWAWDWMKRGVLKADFWMYLIPLVRGGVYADVDVKPVKPIEQWGTVDVEYLSLESTDGPYWRSSLSHYPTVVVGVDVDVHQRVSWSGNDGWPRPLGICQWTLASAPSHPIFLDAVRRVVNATKVVKEWEDWRASEIENLKSNGEFEKANDMESWKDDRVMPVMEWTGPGLFTDSVMAFLLARYNVTWHRIRGLKNPLRIGDVLILPITSFSPGGEEDFQSGHSWDRQGAVIHDFRGSWKDDGW